MPNMEIWNKLCKVPAWALKKIKAGRLKGKSDINPQWRYEALTTEFGPVGTGWKHTIDDLWKEPVHDGIVLCFARVTLSIKKDGEWDAGTPGIGGNQMVQKETKGLHANDECYKMAVTDALSVAAKMHGVGADVYKGLSDSKYPTDGGNNNGNNQQPPKKDELPPIITKFNQLIYTCYKEKKLNAPKGYWKVFRKIIEDSSVYEGSGFLKKLQNHETEIEAGVKTDVVEFLTINEPPF